MVCGQDTYLDNFSTVSYSRDDGNQNWASDWVENGQDTNNGPSSQYINVTGNRLRFYYIWGESIRRSVDLSGASSAVLSFDWETISLNGSQRLAVQISSNGGLSYTTLGYLTGTATNSFSQDISAYLSANTVIRFDNINNNWASNDYAYVDNVLISATPNGPAVIIDDEIVDEDAGTVTFTATHTGVNTGLPFTVNYTTNDISATAPADYTSSSGTLNFNGIVGDSDQFTVAISDDFVFEGNETFTVQFTGSSNGAVNISDTATGTIVDDESDPNATRPYEERDARNLMGNFLMRGNTNLQCISGCPTTTNNPGANMAYIDVDADGTTQNSSSSTFNIPAGANVEWAGLYWGGMYNSSNGGITNPPGTLNIDQVKFREPGAGTYTTINAQVRNIETVRFSGWRSFMSHADVTTIVQSAGSGNYFVADIALATGSSFTGPYGGWTMVVVYSDPTEKSRRINVWDGFNIFRGGTDNFTVTGLLTPSSGTFETHSGYFGMDGEANQTGDFVSINGTQLTNGLNPNNNTLNGTISEFGVDLGGRNPNFTYSWGIDVDVFDASGTVGNGATDLGVSLGSTSDGIWGGVFVVSNEIAFPAVASKAFTSSTVSVGDESTVNIVVDNPSNGVNLTNFALTDNFPANMIIAPTPDASSSCGGIVLATPGNNNFSVSGVSIPAGSSCTFTFDVITTTDGTFVNTISPSDITNTQNIPLQGESSGTLTVLPLTDSDNDGVADKDDLDDDNDGIPDVDELNTIVDNSQPVCGGDTSLDFSAASSLISGTALQQGAVYRIPGVTTGTDALVTIVQTVNATVANVDNNSADAVAFRPQTAFNLTNPGDRGYIEYNIEFVNSGGTTPVIINKFFMNLNDIDGNANYAEQLWTDNPTSYTISNPTELTMSTDGSWVIGTAGTNEFGGAGNGNPEVNYGVSYTSKSSMSIRVGGEARVAGASASGRQHNIEFSCLTNYNNPENYGIDIDSDGVANHLDLDSDNDGIYDAVEAGHNRTHLNGVVTGIYGANGLANNVETSAESGVINYTIVDTDSSAPPNYQDTNSDDDGCSDANEAYANNNADGGDNEYYTTGDPPTVDANGRVTAAAYPVPADSGSNGTLDYVEDTVPVIGTQPQNTIVCPGCDTTFTVVASNADSYQWQLFNGATWVDLTNSGIHGGVTTDTLIITNASTSDNGNQYRVLVYSDNYICGPTVSDFVNLIVQVNSVITNRRITYRIKKN